MSYLVLVALSLLWLGFFLPSLLQSRRTSSPLGSVETFQESLTRISTGHAVTPEEAAAAARRRRPPRSRKEIARQRDILTGLTAGVAASIALSFAFGGPARWLIVPAALSLIGYVAVLRLRVVQARAPRRMPVPAPRTFPVTEARSPEPDVVPSVRRRSGQIPDRELERVAG